MNKLQNILSEIKYGFLHIEYCFNCWKILQGYSKPPKRMYAYTWDYEIFWLELSDGWFDMEMYHYFENSQNN